jgi:hypothetical protein
MYSFAIENRIAANENSHRSPNQTERLLSTATGSIMLEAVVLPLDTWQNFYVIVGTAAATLTGLMFVVITLIAQIQAQRQIPSSRSHITVFTTSNVFHFSAVLLAAGILSAPWPALWPAGLLLGLAGLAGVTYMLIVLWLARHRLSYQPVLSDWLWYTVLPLGSYATLVVAAIVLPSQPVPALFVIAAVTMLLLFVGIRNAWDVVTYAAFERSEPQDNKLGK